MGIKNDMSGGVEPAVLGATAARAPHASLGVQDCGRMGIVRSPGNRDAHVVLRGGRDGPNCSPQDVAGAVATAAPLALARPVLVDCSHGNSRKDHRQQGAVCRDILDQVSERQSGIAGVLLESHLVEGRQDWEPGQEAAPDRSITDACIGWQETVALLEEASEAVRSSR